MRKAKPTKLARRHWKYALLAYAIIGVLIIAVILKPSHVLIWAAGSLTLLIVIAVHYHVKQGHIHKDTIVEYVLVLIAALVVLLGALRH